MTMKAHNTIREAWETFSDQVIHPQAGADQRLEMRRCFYAGAWMMLQMAIHAGDDCNSLDEGAALINRLKDELQLFALMNSGGGE